MSKGSEKLEKPRIRISVRNLIEFLLRSGDISPAVTAGTRQLQEGTQIHRRIQAEAGHGYLPEVRLSYEMDFDEFSILVEGIADGVIHDGHQPTLDEIKSTSMPLEFIDEAFSLLHWAQAKCYGWMYVNQTGAASAIIRLTYCHSKTNEIKQLTVEQSCQELKDYFFSLVQQYAQWVRVDVDHKIRRNQSIHSLGFPFPRYRKGQRQLAAHAYRALRDQKLLFVQAPTGTGKTISVLFPAVKAMGEGLGEKIFYLTAKTVTRKAAEQTIQIMVEKGLFFRSVTLTAKEKICFLDTPVCDPENCPYARGHYDRINAAIMDILHLDGVLTRELVLKYAKMHQVCPFEYSLDIAVWADCIICDYNHAFDPRAYLRRFFDTGGDYVLLVDEAHNLADRARDMYSAELSKQSFMTYRAWWKQSAPEVYKRFASVNRWFIAARKTFESKYDTRAVDFPADLVSCVREFTKELEILLTENRSSLPDKMTDLYFQCRAFLAAADLFDERYTAYVSRRANEVNIKLLCANPSYLLRKAYGKNRAAVFFSGTLQPMDFYVDILGGDQEDRILCLPSPFQPENFCLMISGEISTRYRDRKDSFDGIAHYIKAAVSQKTGNYMVYFPSFEYLNHVLDAYQRIWPEDYSIVQQSRMDDDEREEFLNAFDEMPARTMIAFAVMGGLFSEGIDLAGDRLSGAVVVGVGLPQLSAERDLISDYYRKTNGRGFEYAYMLPGLNRVMQAAGRVIRTEEDRGFVLLLDDRFLHRRYLDLYPAEWQHFIKVSSSRQVSQVLAEFWT